MDIRRADQITETLEPLAILAALTAGDRDAAEQALRSYVAVQGKKCHQLMASRKRWLDH